MSTPLPPQGPTRRPLWLLIAAASLAAITALALWGVWLIYATTPAVDAPTSHAQSSAPQSTPQSGEDQQSSAGQQSNAAQSASSTAQEPPADTQEIPQALHTALTRMSQVLASPNDAPDASDILAESALEELDAARNEWELMGYRQEGAPTITDIHVTPDPQDPTRQQVLACVDYSNVRIIKDDGTPITDEEAPERSRLLIDMELIDGQWKVTDQSFPEDPDC